MKRKLFSVLLFDECHVCRAIDHLHQDRDYVYWQRNEFILMQEKEKFGLYWTYQNRSRKSGRRKSTITYLGENDKHHTQYKEFTTNNINRCGDLLHLSALISWTTYTEQFTLCNCGITILRQRYIYRESAHCIFYKIDFKFNCTLNVTRYFPRRM